MLADSARMAELDRLTIQYNSKLRAAGLESQATLSEMEAKTARTASYFEAAGQAASAYTSYTGTKIPGMI